MLSGGIRMTHTNVLITRKVTGTVNTENKNSKSYYLHSGSYKGPAGRGRSCWLITSACLEVSRLPLLRELQPLQGHLS